MPPSCTRHWPAPVPFALSGTEGYLPDDEPVLGPSLSQPGLLHGFGFAGAGFQIGPAAGEALAQCILHGAPALSLAAFSIKRFQPHHHKENLS